MCPRLAASRQRRLPLPSRNLSAACISDERCHTLTELLAEISPASLTAVRSPIGVYDHDEPGTSAVNVLTWTASIVNDMPESITEEESLIYGVWYFGSVIVLTVPSAIPDGDMEGSIPAPVVTFAQASSVLAAMSEKLPRTDNAVSIRRRTRFIRNGGTLSAFETGEDQDSRPARSSITSGIGSTGTASSRRGEGDDRRIASLPLVGKGVEGPGEHEVVSEPDDQSASVIDMELELHRGTASASKMLPPGHGPRPVGSFLYKTVSYDDFSDAKSPGMDSQTDPLDLQNENTTNFHQQLDDQYITDTWSLGGGDSLLFQEDGQLGETTVPRIDDHYVEETQMNGSTSSHTPARSLVNSDDDIERGMRLLVPSPRRPVTGTARVKQPSRRTRTRLRVSPARPLESLNASRTGSQVNPPSIVAPPGPASLSAGVGLDHSDLGDRLITKRANQHEPSNEKSQGQAASHPDRSETTGKDRCSACIAAFPDDPLEPCVIDRASGRSTRKIACVRCRSKRKRCDAEDVMTEVNAAGLADCRDMIIQSLAFDELALDDRLTEVSNDMTEVAFLISKFLAVNPGINVGGTESSKKPKGKGKASQG